MLLIMLTLIKLKENKFMDMHKINVNHKYVGVVSSYSR